MNCFQGNNITFVEWFWQDYVINAYKGSAVGLAAGLPSLKTELVIPIMSNTSYSNIIHMNNTFRPSDA